MNNDEIRLSVLCQCYMSKFGGAKSVYPEKLELQDVDEITRDVNLEYLMDKGLLVGGKLRGNHRTMITAVNITAWGMDVVEDIVNRSLDELEPGLRQEVEKEGDTHKRLNTLYEKCVKSAPVCEAVAKVAHAILVALGHG